jgi:hypothetical protein
VNRRAARWLAPILLLASIVIAVTFGVPTARADAFWEPRPAAMTATVPEPPPDTPNEFLPDERNLSDCVGVLEKPGCGSKERGGTMMNAVFLIVIGGMAFIFWRIIIGVRKNRAALERSGLDGSETIGP